MLIKFTIWLIEKMFNNKHRKSLEPCITRLYRRMATENMKISTEIVKVKKGRKRYDLMFFITPKGKYKFNLGRHWVEEERYPMISDVPGQQVSFIAKNGKEYRL